MEAARKSVFRLITQVPPPPLRLVLKCPCRERSHLILEAELGERLFEQCEVYSSTCLYNPRIRIMNQVMIYHISSSKVGLVITGARPPLALAVYGVFQQNRALYSPGSMFKLGCILWRTTSTSEIRISQVPAPVSVFLSSQEVRRASARY